MPLLLFDFFERPAGGDPGLRRGVLGEKEAQHKGQHSASARALGN